MNYEIPFPSFTPHRDSYLVHTHTLFLITCNWDITLMPAIQEFSNSNVRFVNLVVGSRQLYSQFLINIYPCVGAGSINVSLQPELKLRTMRFSIR